MLVNGYVSRDRTAMKKSYQSYIICRVAEWTKRLQRAKVSVILTKPENRCYGNTDFYLILIEKMNLLGKVDAWDNLIRIKSESIVQELMGMILKEFCDNDLTSSGGLCVEKSLP